MQTSETIGKIAEALCKAQAEMEHASKSATNPHFKSRYADLAAVIDAARPALSNHGIALVQSAESHAEGFVSVATRLAHTSGEWMQSTLTVPVSKRDAQGYGSAVTYARRYGLQAICGIAAEDDDGSAAASAPTRPQAAPQQPRPSAGEVSRSEEEHIAKIRAAQTAADLQAVRKSIPEPERTPAVREAYQVKASALIAAA